MTDKVIECVTMTFSAIFIYLIFFGSFRMKSVLQVFMAFSLD